MARSCGGPCPAMQSSICMIVIVHMVQGLRQAAHFTTVAPIRLCPWAYLFCHSLFLPLVAYRVAGGQGAVAPKKPGSTPDGHKVWPAH